MKLSSLKKQEEIISDKENVSCRFNMFLLNELGRRVARS